MRVAVGHCHANLKTKLAWSRCGNVASWVLYLRTWAGRKLCLSLRAHAQSPLPLAQLRTPRFHQEIFPDPPLLSQGYGCVRLHVR